MALNTQLTNLVANTQANALAVLLNGGFIDIYDGTQPATADTAISTQVLLVTLTLSGTAFASSVAGTITANTITPGIAVATSSASWFRAYKNDHTTAVFDGSVGVIIGQANLVLSSTTITTGLTVSVSSLTHTVAKFAVGY